MDIKQQAITEYLTQGTGYRQLAAKYGVSRTMNSLPSQILNVSGNL